MNAFAQMLKEWRKNRRYSQLDLSVAAVRDAIATLLGNHMPMPALAFDGHWCAVDANPAANLLMNVLGVEPDMNLVELSRLYAQLDKHPRWHGSEMADAPESSSIICMRIQHEDIELCLFSMVAQFGSVQEISLGDTRVELFFPQDEKTREFFMTAEDKAAVLI